MSRINRIGVLTSGGDSPGMNAAVRAVVRAAIYNEKEVYGIYRGYEGMIDGDIHKLESKDVSNIIQRGGTILKTARSERFRTKEGRAVAYEKIKEHNIDSLVLIGGDGTFAGAGIFSQEYDIPCVGIPGTIDNDMFGTDYTIGFDTCLNTVVEAIDRIRDTASAHDRIFFVEVMGRDAGFVALQSGIATGAEGIMVPEVDNQVNKLMDYLERNISKSSIVVVSEGEKEKSAEALAEMVRQKHPERSVRVTVLGHIQRGGSPSAFDRYLASRLGVAAVEALLDDQRSIMVGYANHEVVHVPFNKTIKRHHHFNLALFDVSDILAI
jgi:6-phosphofructokinase 1